MIEIIWQVDPASPNPGLSPASASEARQLLEKGNRGFADMVADLHNQRTARHVRNIAPENLGLSGTPGIAPQQAPFAALLSCADARVPTELVFTQAANHLFVVRVAGNVLTASCLGSLDYAVENLDSVRLLVVLGHTGCGAVTAAVDAYLTPGSYINVAIKQPLRVIIDNLMPVVLGAGHALANSYGPDVSRMPGYRLALTEMSVSMNAALVAGIVQNSFAPLISEKLDVAYAVYNLHNHVVGQPGGDSTPDNWEVGLFSPPQGEDGFVKLSEKLADSAFIDDLLQNYE